MVSKLIIEGQNNIDAKDITNFIHRASRYKSHISIEKDDRKADGKSLMGLLSLSVRGGDVINIKAEGIDELEAIDVLTGFIRNNFKDN